MPNLNDFHWTEADFRSIEVADRIITLDASVPLCDDPPIDGVEQYREITVHFKGVSKSRRKIFEYIGDPRSGDGFRPEYMIEDVDETTGGTEYFLEGVMLSEPQAWVEWELRADEVAISVRQG